MTNHTDLTGETVLVTGAGSGIGEAVARAFAAAGARLVLAGRRAERLRDLSAELGARTHALPLDVSDPAAPARAVSGLPAGFAGVSILVNNAGLALGYEPVQEAPIEDLDRVLRTNILGVVHCTHALVPGMVARGRGHVVMLGSIGATRPYRGGHVYSASKAFVHQFAACLQCDLAGTGVRVTTIEPGRVETEFEEVRVRGDRGRAAAAFAEITPLAPADVAEAILWAVSRPAHVVVSRIEMWPACQVPSPPMIVRRPG